MKRLIYFLLFIVLSSFVYAVECGGNPIDGCVITTNTTFDTGTYYLPSGLRIEANNLVLNCNGAILVGSGPGVGIYLENKSNIEIKNCNISSYEYGMYILDSEKIKIRNNIIHSISSLELEGWPGVGSALYLSSSSDIIISSNIIYEVKGADQNTWRRPGGYAVGIYATDSQNFFIIKNNIFQIYGGKGGNANYYYSGYEGGRGLGIYFLNSNNMTVSENNISIIMGGRGGRHYDYNPGQNGGLASGIYHINSKGNNITSNYIFDIKGGDGADYGGVGGFGYGIYNQHSNNSIISRNFISYIDGGTNSHFQDQPGSDIVLENSDHNIINYNELRFSEIGISLAHSDNNSIEFNNIFNGFNCALNNLQDLSIKAENNWWGSAEESYIQSKICDCLDDPSRGCVDYIPWLAEPVAMPNCSDGIKNQDETDIDCGGSCPKCSDGKSCLQNSDCEGNYCNSNNICAAPSCNDGVMNGDEEGVDCGGICHACEPKCIPLKINGNKENKIDLVFIPEKDYEGNISLFLEHVRWKMNNLSEADTIRDNMGDFNFYYSREEGNIILGAFINLPGYFNFYKKCPFTDSIAVLHTGELDDFTASVSGNKYTAEGYYTKAFLHETGHGVFGLADQYDDSSCRTSYFQSEEYPNVWGSRQGCEQDATITGKWSNSDCNKFTDCQGGWWKMSQFDDNIMIDGYNTDRFDEASKLRINWVLEETRNGNRPSGHYGTNYENNGTPKSVVVTFNIRNNELTKIDEEIVEGYSPNHLADSWQFSIQVKLENDSISEEYSIPDPRIVFVEQGSNYTTNYLNDTNFTIIFPFYNHLKKVKVEDKNDSATQIETNLSDIISDYCEDNPEDLDCLPSFSIPLAEGWNLISLPLRTLNMSVSSVLKDIDYEWIFSYGQNWFVPDTFDNNLGYWIFVNRSQVLEIGGYIPIDTDLTSELMGWPFLESLNLSDIDPEVDLYILTYNASSKEWITYNSKREKNSLKYLEPGYGYFIS